MNLLRIASHQAVVVVVVFVVVVSACNKEAPYGTCVQRVEILETV
jgi:hypothetical protein